MLSGLKTNYNRVRETIGTLVQNVRGMKGSAGGLMSLDWKRLLKLSQDEVLGLDIGSSSVKMVQLRKNGAGYTATAAGIVDIENANETDDAHREINIAGAISKCLDLTGVQTRLAVCSVCGPEVAVRYFKFPSLLQEEIPGAVMLEAEQLCPFNIADGAVDYQLIPDGENNVSGVLVAATNKLIRRKSRLVEDVSLSCVLMDVDGLALLNCFSEQEKFEAGCSPGRSLAQPGTTAILNVGSSHTILAITSDNGLPFIRDITYAGKTIIEKIATEHNVSTETIGKILSGYGSALRRDESGCEGSGLPRLDLGDSLGRACQQLIVDVAETLRYYAAREKTSSVERIFVCGSFSLVKGFVELLNNQLPAAAVLWNPFDKIRCDADRSCRDLLQKNGPALAVAAGLAMRSI